MCFPKYMGPLIISLDKHVFVKKKKKIKQKTNSMTKFKKYATKLNRFL